MKDILPHSRMGPLIARMLARSLLMRHAEVRRRNGARLATLKRTLPYLLLSVVSAAAPYAPGPDAPCETPAAFESTAQSRVGAYSRGVRSRFCSRDVRVRGVANMSSR